MGLHPSLAGLSCFACGLGHQASRLQTTCRSCGLPLRVDYRLDRLEVDERVASLWRYRGVLPLVGGEVTLGEGWTPLVRLDDRTWIKDETANPTGSFKARGMSLAVSMARLLGAGTLAAPSAGNAAAALAAYGEAAGLPVVVAMPEDTPPSLAAACREHGAIVHLVGRSISEAGAWLGDHGPRDALDLATMREPYRVEGKKTMAYELWEQLEGELPEVIVVPTGGGTALVGIWKALGELRRLGLAKAVPRLAAVQAAGCAPVVAAFEAGSDRTEPWEAPKTEALGLRVPDPIGGLLCLRALAETGGTALAIPEEEIGPAAADLARRSGIEVGPEAAAAWAGAQRLRGDGWIGSGERVVVLATGRPYPSQT